jgi:hypothetical protein
MDFDPVPSVARLAEVEIGVVDSIPVGAEAIAIRSGPTGAALTGSA